MHSTHALSKSVLSSLSSTQTIEASNFQEYQGLGIEALVADTQIKLGASQWIKGSESVGNSAEVHVSIAEVYRGYFSIQNQYRDDTQEMFTALSAEYSFAVFSGDNDAELQVLKELAPKAEIKFRQSPFDKKEYLKTLNDAGLQTMMIGDGLNDAGALMEAKIGVAVSENSANFTPASDAILEAKDITQLPFF
jgi:P-type Cu+ transporter